MGSKMKSVQLLFGVHGVHHLTVRPHVSQKPAQVGQVALYLADAERPELEILGVLGRPGLARRGFRPRAVLLRLVATGRLLQPPPSFFREALPQRAIALAGGDAPRIRLAARRAGLNFLARVTCQFGVLISHKNPFLHLVGSAKLNG
jgi:hypothetical protein